VLFADLVGFTGLSEGVDPEQVRNLVDGAFQRLVADVGIHGGRIDKIVGDQLVVLFGAPVAHEDDAERAVRAGLQMQATLAAYAAEVGVPISMRVGINTGEALVGALRAGGEYTAMGDTINVGSRIQTAAAPGQILVSEATYAQTSDVVRYESLGPLQARGRDEPVETYAAVETLAPPGHRPKRARTPLIGRDREMGILCASLSMAFDRRRPQSVVISGDAGVGKSRLAEELASSAAAEHSAVVLEGRCVPYGEANVWWPIAAAVRQALGIAIDDTAEEARRKTRSKVAWGLKVGDDHPDVQLVTDGLCYLLGVPTALNGIDPTRAREGAVRSFVGLLHNMAHRKPLVLSISELHWADELVLDLVDRLPELMRGLPFALVATTRPELEERWMPKPGRHNLVTLHLDPLDRESSERLLATLLEGSAGPALTNTLLDRSGGNPFFLEELAGLVHQSGGRAGELPVTLRALVATRLDGLPMGERRVVDHAAVVGRLGSMEALTALGGSANLWQSVEELVARDILTFDGGEWVFRSELVREVAYETLTKAERARHHATLGQFLAQQAKERGREGEHVEALAHHFSMAAELLGELGAVEGLDGDVLDQAVGWIERAGTRAEERETSAVAEQLFGRALELLPADRGPERRRFQVRRARARATLRHHDLARADVAAVLADAEAAGDQLAAAMALTVRGHIEQGEGALLESAANLDEAIARWRALGDRAGEADARRLRGMTDLFLGRLTTAEANITEALTLFKELGDVRGEAWAQQNMAWISMSTGDTVGAGRRIDEAVRLFTEIGDNAGLGWAYGLLGWVRLQQGYLEEADELAQRVLAEYDVGGDEWARGMMQLLSATTRLWLGHTDEAVHLAGVARASFAAIGDNTGELRSVATLARATLAAGRIRQSRELLIEATAMADREFDQESRALGRLLTAGTAVNLGETGRVLDVGELLEPATGEGMGPGGLERQVSAASALLQLGRDEQAENLLASTFAAASDPGLLQSSGSTLAFAHAVNGHLDSALAMAEKVEAFEHGTYLDRLSVFYARGFAHVQRGEGDEARRQFGDARALVDSTGDRLAQAFTRLAEARALEGLDDPSAPDRLAEAEERLAELGIGDSEWDGVFRRAALKRF
jgi:class 3 adenylate cyclase/tetratricopeptide (TPR) repeat protein